jgi:hypothetical protein
MKILLACLAALACLIPAVGIAQPTGPKLSVTRNAGGDVLIAVSGTVPACGLTALNEPPAFTLEGMTIKVHQPVVGVACMNPPPKNKRYERVLNVGKLAEGRYTIDWSFPALTGTYTNPGH